jgi:hypothetical protein
MSILALQYRYRIALIALGLAVLTVAAIRFAPRVEDIHVQVSTPSGGQVPVTSPISITFSRPVEQRSAERAFVLYPPVKGRFSWPDAQTLVFTPSEPLQAQTTYRVTIRPGLRDTRGHINRFPVSWPFRTG